MEIRDELLHHKEEVKGTIVFAIESPLGTNVYRECMTGKFRCVYSIGVIDSQLKPCRFASYILGGPADFNDKYL